MSRSSKTPFLLDLPWWMLAAMATTVHIVGNYLLPALSFDHILLNGLAQQAPNLANTFSVLLLVFSVMAGIRALWQRRNRRTLLARQTGLDSIRALSWQRFEHLVGEAFRQQGYQVEERGGAGADGGIDLVLRQGGLRTLVQCKHWRTTKIGVPTVRELLGAMTAQRGDRGVVVCTGYYTQPAITFAKSNGIVLIDGEALVELINVTEDTPVITGSAECLDCPACGAVMVERVAKRGAKLGQSFLGCSQFPKCRTTQPI